MITNREIPDWKDKTEQGLRNWWWEMAARGLAFHPDDLPETIVGVEDGAPLFDGVACRKLRRIFQEMFQHHGDRVYQVGQEMIMRKLGWAKSPSGDWVPAASIPAV